MDTYKLYLSNEVFVLHSWTQSGDAQQRKQLSSWMDIASYQSYSLKWVTWIRL